MLHVALPDRTAPVAVTMQDGGADLAPGQAVWLTWQDEAILMLDSDPPGQDSR
jgi:hypothetical protein